MICNGTDLKSIGKRIKSARENCKMKQEELSEKLHCANREVISYYENGNRDIKTGTLIGLSEALGVTTDYLLGLSEAKTTDPKIREICEHTGLNDATVEFLHNHINDTEIKVLNSLIGTMNFWKLLGVIDEYRDMARSAFRDEMWMSEGNFNPITDLAVTESAQKAQFKLFRIQQLIMQQLINLIEKDGANNG